jgi:hypothetical protein
MPYSESLACRLRDVLRGRHDVAEKKMFGGLAFLLRGNLCVCVWQQALIVRIGPEHYAGALAQPHVGEFDITGRPMRGWVLVEADGIDLDAELRHWVNQAVEFVQTLPAK